MIRGSIIFRVSAWICFALAVNVCTHEIGRAQNTDPAEPGTAETVPNGDSNQIDTPVILLKGQPAEPDTTELAPQRDPAQPASEEEPGITSPGDPSRPDTTAIYRLPGRDGPDRSQTNNEIYRYTAMSDGPDTGYETGAQPIYGRWWFWAIGAAVLGTTVILLMGGDDAKAEENLPDFPPPPER